MLIDEFGEEEKGTPCGREITCKHATRAFHVSISFVIFTRCLGPERLEVRKKDCF
jgi:hypothetical protein